jgi:uncharacterized protein
MDQYSILVFSDMHGAANAIPSAKKLLKEGKYDLVAYLGDFSERPGDAESNIRDASLMINVISPLAKFVSLIGNCDTQKLQAFIEEKGVSLHNRAVLIGKTAIIGWGGSHPTPFNTPSEFSEEIIERSLEKLFLEAIKIGAERIVLLTHEPPARTSGDKLPFGHVGSESIRRIIEKYQPVVDLCGHIHEAKSVDHIGKTKVINVGPSSKGHFVAISLGDSLSYREINL